MSLEGLHLISAAAMPAWLELGRAIDEAGPVPCEKEPELWWPSAMSRRIEEALAGCSSCMVREACASYAAAAGERDGVWGGRFLKGRPS